jgi:precorrin-6B methylase 2
VGLSRRTFVVVALFSLFVVGVAPARAAQTDYQPRSGQPGKDVVWVPSPTAMVEALLDLAQVAPEDYVIDLGSGDGRNVIAAAKRGARAHGIEYDAGLVEVARRNAAKNGVTDRATFAKADVFESDFSKASVIVLFLTPEMNIRLRPKLLSLKPGTRIVANTFGIGDWNADKISAIPNSCERWCTARLWIVPAKIAGTWKLADGELMLRQTYQTFSGALKAPSGALSVAGRLRGADIFFSDGKTQFTGGVTGNLIEGFARRAGKDSRFKAKRIGN